MSKNRRVIIIGASGFLGKQICEEFIQQGYDLHCVMHKSKIELSQPFNIINGGIKALKSSLIDSIDPLFIVHCARPTFPKFRKLGRILAAQKAGILNANILLELQKSTTKPKLIFASGTLSYGNNDEPVYEDCPINPISYARQYVKGELPIIESCKENTYPIIVLRFPWLLSEGSWFNWFYLQNIKLNSAIPVFGNGDNKMSIIDLTDASKLMVKYALQDSLHGIYNIFMPKVYSQFEFANEVAKEFKTEAIPYHSIYPKKLEKEALEAFTSSIIPASNYMDIIDNHEFVSMKDTLIRIKNS